MKMYREMYAQSSPTADWDEMVKSGEAMRDNFFRSYYLPREEYEEIYNRICKEHKLTKREETKVSFTVNLGSSPSSVKPTGWDAEEN